MQELARQLFKLEIKRGSRFDLSNNVTVRVCEKLRTSLSQFAGIAGYSSLLSRALTLASLEEPALKKVQVGIDGTLQGFDEIEKALSTKKSAEDPGVALVGHLLTLLVTFIGASISLSLLREAWPNESFGLAEQKAEERK